MQLGLCYVVSQTVLPAKVSFKMFSYLTGLLIIRGEKSEISRDLTRQIRGENGRFRGIFAGIFGANFR